MKPLVSVVMPTFGRSDYLLRAINSIASQSYLNFELVVVDDNQPDSASRQETERAVAGEISAKRFNLRYVRRESNGGGSRARNDGIAASQGELVTFLDDDDEYLPEKIGRQVDHILSCRLDISLCGMEAVRNGKPVKYEQSFPSGTTLREFVLHGNAFTPMLMAKRSLLTKVGGFPISPRFQDHLLMLRLLETNPATGIIPERLYRFHMHDGERVTYSKGSIEALKLKHSAESQCIGVLTDRERDDVRVRQRTELLSVLAKHGEGIGRDLTLALRESSGLSESIRYLKAAAMGLASRSSVARAIKQRIGF